MKSIVLCEVGKFPAWVSHVQERWENTVGSFPLDWNVRLNEHDARAFLPADVSPALTSPSQSIVPAAGNQRLTAQGWIKRHDLFDTVVDWLKGEFTQSNAILVCAAGYSEVGDNSLKQRRHIIISQKPFLIAPIQRTKKDYLVKTLRWARSWQMTGVVLLGNDDLTEIVSEEMFLCDVLDGDSVAIVLLERQ